LGTGLTTSWPLKDNHPHLHERVRLAFADAGAAVGTTVATEARHYLSSLPADATALSAATRSDWHIENRLHWVLDVAFREDHNRVRDDHAPQNLAILRHFALNLLRQDRSVRGSVSTKRLRAALNRTYLRSLLNGLSA